MPRAFTRGTRMHKRWVGLGDNTTFVVSADITTVKAIPISRDEPFTVLRMLGEYTLSFSGVDVLDDRVVIGLGIGVITGDAHAAGGGSVPDPVGELGFSWLFWAEHQLTKQIAARESGGDPMMALRRSYDIKTMRKVRPQEVVTQVFQYANQNGNPGVQIAWGQTRVLIAT